MTHHGEALDLIIKRSGTTKDELAEKMGVNRRTIYHWIARDHLPPEVIDRIGEALKIDMGVAAPNAFGAANKVRSARINVPVNVNPADTWKDKYITALEEVNKLKDELQRVLSENAELKARK